MADVQLENGYTRIANELLEALIKFPLNASQYKIILTVIRKTYGFRKKEDWISNSQFVKYTGLNIRTVQREIKNLRNMNILKNKNLQKKFNEWEDVEVKLHPKFKKFLEENDIKTVGDITAGVLDNYDKSVAENDKSVVQVAVNRPPTKEIITKETYTKESITNVIEGKPLEKDTNYFIGKFKTVNPAIQRLFGNKTQRQSIENLRKQFGDEKLEKMIDFLPRVNSTKYAPTITTPYDLETKMGALQAFYLKEKDGRSKFVL